MKKHDSAVCESIIYQITDNQYINEYGVRKSEFTMLSNDLKLQKSGYSGNAVVLGGAVWSVIFTKIVC